MEATVGRHVFAYCIGDWMLWNLAQERYTTPMNIREEENRLKQL